MSIGLPEVLIVLVILLVIFGGSRIPKVAQALGTGWRELRGQVERDSPDDEEIEAGREPPPPTAEPVEDEEPAKRP